MPKAYFDLNRAEANLLFDCIRDDDNMPEEMTEEEFELGERLFDRAFLSKRLNDDEDAFEYAITAFGKKALRRYIKRAPLS